MLSYPNVLGKPVSYLLYNGDEHYTRQWMYERARWDTGKSAKNHENVPRHMFFYVIFSNKHSFYYMFNDMSTPSFANLDLCNIKFLQCKSSLLNIYIF